jgi:hypothetical protein
MLSTPSSSEIQERLSLLLSATRQKQQQNLAKLRRNIEAVDSPVEGTQPRRYTQSMTRTENPADEALERSIEQTRIARARMTLPPPKKGVSDWSSGVVDRVVAKYRGR